MKQKNCGLNVIPPGYLVGGVAMTASTEMPDDALFERATNGDEEALALLFTRYRPRLERMAALRLDRRLLGRVDPADVVQEAYLEVRSRFAAYVRESSVPFFLWLRLVAGQKLTDVHRHHLGTKMRDAGQEVSLYRDALPEASSASLVAQILGRLTTGSEAAVRAERKLYVQEALNAMDPIDREVLVLRHFEQLSNDETAITLGLRKSAASQRYMRALKRLKEILSAIPGLGDDL
jgi:RNA polymerase sigma-70 factor (ECF subfamily)